MKRLGLLLSGLLVLPHTAQAASIPVVVTFNEYAAERAYGEKPVYTPIAPIVIHVTLTIDTLMFVDRYEYDVIGEFSGPPINLWPVPSLPAPDGVGPETGVYVGSYAYEHKHEGTGHDTESASAAWLRFVYHGSPEGWRYWESFNLNSRIGPAFIGEPTVQTVVDVLSWGGNLHAELGWGYQTTNAFGGGYLDKKRIANYRGTYALDTTAVPEPGTLGLVMAGAAVAWWRRNASWARS